MGRAGDQAARGAPFGRGGNRRAGHRSRAPLPRLALCGALALPGAVAAQALPDSVRTGADGLTVGLALSGGSAKGFAHVGVLRVLEEAGVRVDVVTGTSMGSVVGGLYAIGLTPDSIESLIAAQDWQAVLSDGVERERRFLHQRRFDERTVATLPIQGGTVGLPSGVTVGSSIMRLAERATWRAAAVRDFRLLPRPFAAIATDLETGEAVVMTGGVLSEAMRASSGIPGAFEPMELEGRLLVDGAVARNLPASDARALGAERVICSDVSDPLMPAEELGSLVDVLDQVMTLATRRETIEQHEHCDVLVRPDVEGISGLAFERWAEWLERGVAAAREHEPELRRLAAEQGEGGGASEPRSFAFLPDSVLVVGVNVAGSTRPQTERLVRTELALEEGSFVSAELLSSHLRDIDATGLFGLVRYRLERSAGGVDLTVHVQERPKDRLGVGLRYDEDRRAALLFTTTLHNLIGYGSVTRLDLRVGEETRARVAYLRRYGVTGRFEQRYVLSWSESDIRLPGPARPTAGFGISALSGTVGLLGERTTFLGLEATAELVDSDFAGVPDVLLASLSGVLDHESLDRIDFPGSGIDATARWEWGVTDLAPDGAFSVLSASAHTYLALHPRVSADLGGFLGVARGLDLPVHRTFFLGGAHPSAVFPYTQPLFHGIRGQELAGTVVQVARAGLRWQARDNLHVRLGVDVGGAFDEWRFPVEDPVVGWGVTLGAGTIVGPVFVEWGKASGHTGRLALGVGRRF